MAQRKTRKSSPRKYAVGTEHQTEQGTIVILEHIPKGSANNTNTRSVIRFKDTGYVANVQTANIPANKIKDRRKPTVYGVGYIGSEIRIPKRGEYIRRVYDLWANMLRRCYHDCLDCYEDVSVDPRWHNFTNFLNTVERIPNYDMWLADGSMHLDKDKSGSRVYSLDTCTFLSPEENTSLARDKRWGRA